jgi:predicted GH43/DUF377 family glycosyl hydrolase
MLPTPCKIDGQQIIYYSGRNAVNQSSIGRFEVDFSAKPRTKNSSINPVLTPGELGHFDDNGVSPSCVIELGNGEIAMYYIGWNPGSTTRVNLYGGLAISQDRGKTFERWSKAPILERTQADPLINTAPWVVKSAEGFRMYYVSGTKWLSKDSPRYNIKIAFSRDGYKWERPGQVVLDFSSELETALARPFVMHENGKWKMWVTRRIGEYAIVYAESTDGIDWVRKDNEYGLFPDGSKEELVMTEYSIVIRDNNQFYMLYNGNDYGKNGILIARTST